MTTLDDLVALLIQGQHPFEEDALRQACAMYRANSPIRGATVRKQVNLAICLYLDVIGERVTERRVSELGGWGSRNDVLADVGSFHRGSRPTSGVSMAVAMPALLPAMGLKAGDALQMAMLQGLEAAQRMIEQSVKSEFDQRLKVAQEDFNRRLTNFEGMVTEATRRQEAAESQRLILERRLDEAGVTIAALSGQIAAGTATWESVKTTNSALTETLARERNALDTLAVENRRLSEQYKESIELADRERRSNLLNVEALRQREAANEKLRASMEKLNELRVQLEMDVVKLKAQIAERESASQAAANVQSVILEAMGSNSAAIERGMDAIKTDSQNSMIEVKKQIASEIAAASDRQSEQIERVAAVVSEQAQVSAQIIARLSSVDKAVSELKAIGDQT